MLDMALLAGELAAIVDEAVERATQPLVQRIALLEVRDSTSTCDEIKAAIATTFAELSAPKIEKEEILPLVRDVIAALPAPENGKDAEIDMDEVARLIEASVSRHMTEIPAPEDGVSVTLDDVRPLIDDAIGKAVSNIPVPKDGVGLAGAVIDRGGNLVVTLTDGSTRDLGPVVGRDYDPAALGVAVREAVAAIPVPKDGSPGKDADPAVIKQMVDEAVAAIPPAKDGKDAYPGEARGLFDPSAEYRALDVVSFNGCEWRAKRDAPGELPGDGWMLSASRGKRGERGERGVAGKDGSTVIAFYRDPDSMKLVLTKDDGTELKADLADLANEFGGR